MKKFELPRVAGLVCMTQSNPQRRYISAGTDVTKAAFISGALRELGVTLYVGNKLVYREGLHVCAAAGGTRAYGHACAYC
jgi:hypothetical protein